MEAACAFAARELQAGDVRAYSTLAFVHPIPNSLWPHPVARELSTSSMDVTFPAARSEWFVESVRRIAQLGKLIANWDSYGAEAPNSYAQRLSRTVLNCLSRLDFKPKSIDASVEGGICIAFGKNGHYADFECCNSGNLLAAISPRDGEPQVWTVEQTDDGVRNAANQIRAFLARGIT